MVGLNKIYGIIGVRYARNCHPDDLWTKYFTSSSKVKTLRKNIGEPDVIEIRKLFNTKEKALAWEEKVLTKLNVLKDERWLNSSIGGKKFFNYGIPRSEECRRKISEKRKLYLANLTDEEREIAAERSRDAGRKGAKKIGEKAKARLSDPEFYQKHVDAHNTDEYRKNLSEKIRSAYQRDDVKERHRASVTSDEYREKISKANINRFSDPKERKKISLALKQVCSSKEYREQMSKRAKASEMKRLQTRLNNLINQNNLLITNLG